LKKVADFDFLFAKLHGMRSLLWEAGRLDELLGKRNLAEVFSSLSGGKTFESHIQFEKELVQRHISDLFSVGMFLSGANGEFFLWLLRRYQVENLKVILRHWAHKKERKELEAIMVELPDELALPVEKLLEAPGLASFLQAIPVKELRDAAGQGALYFEQKGSTFLIETGLDQGYLATLRQFQEKLSAPHRAGSGPLLRLEIDLYNCLLIFRARFGYGLSPEEIRPFLTTGGANLSLEALLGMLKSNTFEEMAGALPAPLLQGSDGGKPADAGELETILFKTLYFRANHRFYSSTSDIGKLIAFFYIKRIELMNLIRLTEGFRFALPAQVLRKNLFYLE